MQHLNKMRPHSRFFRHGFGKSQWMCICLMVCGLCCIMPVYGQLVRVPTKAETRQKQKEYSGKRSEKGVSTPAPGNNAVGKQMARQSLKRNSDPRAMLVRVRRPGDALDINNPRNINLNKQPAQQPLRSRNPMGMAMYKQSLKANSNARSMMTLSPAYRTKMMKKRDGQFADFKGNGKTLTMPDRKSMYRKKSKEISSYKGDILVRKRPQGSYPNMKYRGGMKNSSFEKREKYRKRVLKKMGGKRIVPAHMRRKDEKPRYDTRESEIWDKPK